jgi:hypothetical protein
VGTSGVPRFARSRPTREKSSTIGAVDGSIIAAIIVTQIPTYQPRPPSAVPGPSSIPFIRATVAIQAASAPASSTAAMTIAFSRAAGAGAAWVLTRPDRRSILRYAASSQSSHGSE